MSKIDASAYWSEGASAYERWWVPVLEQACDGLLDRLEREVPDWRAQPRKVLDLGTGTGLLAVGAVRRWPNARVVGMDPARGMLQLARQRAEAAGVAGARISWAEGSAEAIPSGDSAFAAVVSSFVYQFLVDRPRALREILRVLSPVGPSPS